MASQLDTVQDDLHQDMKQAMNIYFECNQSLGHNNNFDGLDSARPGNKKCESKDVSTQTISGKF
jgi:hypothetical protein